MMIASRWDRSPAKRNKFIVSLKLSSEIKMYVTEKKEKMKRNVRQDLEQLWMSAQAF